MSFGFSLGDIYVAVRLAAEIYDKCFTRAKGADVQYMQFGREIQELGENLRRLDQVFDRIRNQPRLPQNRLPPLENSSSSSGPSWYHVNREAEALPDITGDFHSTLGECQRFLGDNSRFSQDRAGFVNNVGWWIRGLEKDVENLRERVRAHSIKILLVIEPLKFELAVDISEDIKAIKRDMAELLWIQRGSTLPVVPDYLEARFVEATMRNRPVTYTTLADFPLQEGLDALVVSFGASTVRFVPGGHENQKMPEYGQYLNLVKSLWILRKLKESTRLLRAGPRSLWTPCFQEYREKIFEEYERLRIGKIVAPDAEVIGRLPEDSYAIWVANAPIGRPPVLEDERPYEERILELPFPCAIEGRQSSLSLFRKSDNELRIVSTTTDSQNDMFREAESFEINTNVTRFIPVYAIPDSPATNNVLFCSTHAQSEVGFSFNSLDHVKEFQQAITGYRVHHCVDKVGFDVFQRPSIRKRSGGHKGRCRAQIWQYKPLSRVAPGTDGNTSPALSATTRRQSTAVASTLADTISSHSTASIISGASCDGVSISMPKPPVLVLYTKYKERYAFLHLLLDDNSYIDKRSCDCRDSTRICCRLVIQSHKKLIVRRHTAEHENLEGLKTWDLALLRLPPHPGFISLDTVSNVGYVCLDFATCEERRIFEVEFKQIESLRDHDIKERKTLIARLGRLA